MTRTDKDTWDLSSSVGATATAVAASRAIASQQPDALLNDPWADPLVRAVGTDIFVKLVDGEIERAEHMDMRDVPADWAERLTERSQRIGSNINLAELFYTGDRKPAADYLGARGWQTDVRTTRQAYSANGFEVPKDDLMSFGDGSGYLTATLI